MGRVPAEIIPQLHPFVAHFGDNGDVRSSFPDTIPKASERCSGSKHGNVLRKQMLQVSLGRISPPLREPN